MLAATLGCTGQADVYTIPFTRGDFGPQEPPVRQLHADEAYWWTDSDGRLNVALRRQVKSILGPAHSGEWVLSLATEGLPAGSEKLYRLHTQSIRMRLTQGPGHERAASLTGVAVLHAPEQGRIHGRFHAACRAQVFSMLTGWSPPLPRGTLTVMAGTFTAVHDAERGREILELSESDNFGRVSAPPATTQPMLVQPSPTQNAP